MDRYANGDHDSVLAELATIPNVDKFKNDFERQADAWTMSAGPEAGPRRRFVAATFALELVYLWLETEWRTVRPLVEWGCKALRKDPASRAERTWHLASIALANGALDEYLLQRGRGFERTLEHLKHVAARFPDDARFELATGVAAEIGSFMAEPPRNKPFLPPRPVDDPIHFRTFRLSLERAELIIKALTAALRRPENQSEAHLRIGYVYFRMYDIDRAITHYQQAVRTGSDPFIVYLAHFFSGRAFERRNQAEEAEAAYRRALAVIPQAQSGVLSLANLLFLRDQRDDAYALIDASFLARRPHDPWRLYGYGDFRFWPELIQQLRREIHR